jgi:hypothetical protein
MTPAQRTTRAKLGAHARWAGETDAKAATAPARKGFMARFEREVDPDGVLTSEERTRRAKHARQAHMTRLALRSSQARASRGNPPGCPPPPPPPPTKAVAA